MALLVDQYELAMSRAYREEGMAGDAVFSLFSRRLPESRNYLLACGLDSVLDYIERLRFTDEALDYLASLDAFDRRFVDWLRDFRFRGDVWAMPEGTPVFGDEPMLEVQAPIPEAQLLETLVMNQMHLQTVLASKAARVKHAAGDGKVVDFGLRRMHGADAGLNADEVGPGRPLLTKVMEDGRRLHDTRRSLDEARTRARDELKRLPVRIRELDPANPPYPVEVSDELARYQASVKQSVAQAEDASLG